VSDVGVDLPSIVGGLDAPEPSSAIMFHFRAEVLTFNIDKRLF